jgi:hypothetical protein
MAERQWHRHSGDAFHRNLEGEGREIRMARTLEVARKPRASKLTPTLEQIQLRAYEIFLERRGGNQIEDWLQAERELAAKSQPKTRKAPRSPKSEAA